MAVAKDIEGVSFRLRSVVESDAEFILRLRNDPEASRYLPPLNITPDAQRAWISRQRLQPDDYYFVVERRDTGAPVGLTSLYKPSLEHAGTALEWGRFVVDPRSMAAPETMLLTHQFAFDVLGLTDVFGFSIKENLKVVSFHKSCGLQMRGDLGVSYSIDGKTRSTFCFGLRRNEWPPVRERVSVSVARVANILERAGAKESRAA